MTKLWEWSVVALLAWAAVMAGIHKYGVMGLLQPVESRGKHCRNERSGWYFKTAQHKKTKSSVDVWTIIASSQKRILPSAYYPTLRASKKGMANAA